MKNHTKILTIGRTIAILSAILLGVSAFLPWGSSAYVSVDGMAGDGWITISIGLLAFILLFIKRISIWLSLFFGILALIIGIVDFNAMLKAIKLVTDGNMGMGLYTTLIASAGIVIGTIVEIIQERSKKLKKKLAYLDDE
jgi:hypothetical protein